MDYTAHYNLLIKRAQTRTLTGYVEQHHIVPKCMGGTNENNNLVELTPEEHYVAHQLLVKMYPDDNSLVYAANMMTTSSKNLQRNNKRYGWLKRKYVKVCKKRVGALNSSYGKGWYYNPTTLEEGKFLISEIPDNWIKGRKTTVTKHTKCQQCGIPTGSKKAKWCDSCRHVRTTCKRNGAIRQPKLKTTFTNADKQRALIANNGNIRKALFSLGLNDSGSNYKKMREIIGGIGV
jgi:hypothetical protein